MERYRRLAVVGCAGSIVLCLALILAPFLYRVGSLSAARWRWARHGAADYSVVVTQACVCYYSGEFRLTVRSGRVVEVVPLAWPAAAARLNPASFDNLTVEAMFERVGRDVRDSWLPRRQRPLRVNYDAETGHVTLFERDDLTAFDAHFAYSASDLEIVGGP